MSLTGIMSKRYIYFSLLIIFVLSSVSAVWNKYFILNSNKWRFTNVSQLEQNMMKVECLALCSQTPGCETVNHNYKTNICELLKSGPWTPTAISTNDLHWAVYYKGDRLVSALSAWQTSTKIYEGNNERSASLAIDGNRKNTNWKQCSCTDDYSSSWAMEFDHVVEVSHIIVYFRGSQDHNSRNTNLRFLISETRQHSDSNIGTDCNTYFGPPESPLPPEKITCKQPVTGKFLKIIFNMPNNLVLCEVEVYTS